MKRFLITLLILLPILLNAVPATAKPLGRVELIGRTASRLMQSDASSRLEIVPNPCAYIAGAAGRMTCTDDGDGTITLDVVESGLDHGLLDATSLTHDDHPGYLWLNGRSGGQDWYFDTASGGGGNIYSTSHATKGSIGIGGTVNVNESTNRVGFGTGASATYTYDFLGNYGVDHMLRFYLTSTAYFIFNKWGTASFIGPTNSANYTLFSFLGNSDSYSRIAFGLDTGNGYMLFGPGSTAPDIKLERVGGSLYYQFGTSPVNKYAMTSTRMYFYDNIKATFGTGSDIDVYSDGTDGHIYSAGSAKLIVDVPLVSTSRREISEKRITSGDSPYTLLPTDYFIDCDTDGGAIEIDVTAGTSGHEIVINNTGSAGNDCDIDPNGAETILGQGAGVAIALHDSEEVDLRWNSTNYWR